MDVNEDSWLHDRMRHIDASGIRKVFDLAAKLENPINLSIGQPDFDVPEAVKKAAIDSIRAGRNRYTQTQGTAELREAVREDLVAHRHWHHLAHEQVLITSGVSGGLMLAFMALFGHGDEVIIPDPYFVMYKHLLRLLGVTPVYIDTYPDFTITAARIEPLITPRTKAVVIGSPSNPTGATISEAHWREIVEMAHKHDLLIIDDEIYEEFVYDQPHFSPASLTEHILLLGGFSKSHAMTGWRLGYAAGPQEIIDAMTTIQQYTFVCAPSMAQDAGVAALKLDTSDWATQYKAKRDKMVKALSGKYEIQGANGAFYLFPRVPAGYASGTDFCMKAIHEQRLLIIPGSVFSEKDTHFRISYAATDETLDRGIAALMVLAD